MERNDNYFKIEPALANLPSYARVGVGEAGEAKEGQGVLRLSIAGTELAVWLTATSMKDVGEQLIAAAEEVTR